MGLAGTCILAQDEIGIRKHLLIFVTDLVPVVRSNETEYFAIAVNMCWLVLLQGCKNLNIRDLRFETFIFDIVSNSLI